MVEEEAEILLSKGGYECYVSLLYLFALYHFLSLWWSI